MSWLGDEWPEQCIVYVCRSCLLALRKPKQQPAHASKEAMMKVTGGWQTQGQHSRSVLYIWGGGVGGRSRHRYAKPKGSAHLGSNPTDTTSALPHEVQDACGMSKIKGGRLNFLLVCMCCCTDDSQLSAHSTVTCTNHELGASHTRFCLCS